MTIKRMTTGAINLAIDQGRSVVVELEGTRYSAVEGHTAWPNIPLVAVMSRASSIPLDKCRVYVDGALMHEPLEGEETMTNKPTTPRITAYRRHTDRLTLPVSGVLNLAVLVAPAATL